MVAENVKKHPIILWAQRDNVLFLTVEVDDMKIEKLVCDGNKFFISGTNSSGVYEADLELYAPIKGSERRQIETARQVELVFPKETVEWWPRLLKKSIKVPWLKVDFNKWIDEDEVNEDAVGGGGFDFSNMNFPGANMLGEGLGGDMEDESDSEEDDNSDIPPPLDDIEAEKPTSSSTA